MDSRPVVGPCLPAACASVGGTLPVGAWHQAVVHPSCCLGACHRGPYCHSLLALVVHSPLLVAHHSRSHQALHLHQYGCGTKAR